MVAWFNAGKTGARDIILNRVQKQHMDEYGKCAAT
jgi:hypothetical protein